MAGVRTRAGIAGPRVEEGSWAAEWISGCGPGAGEKSAHAQVCYSFSLLFYSILFSI